MKKLMFIILLAVVSSCGAIKQTIASLGEDDLIITRKFVGIYMGYRHTGPENYEGPNLLWIKTSMEGTYGKISAYGRKCEFTLGDRLYLRRTRFNPAISSGYWVYVIENDSEQSYRATEFQHDRKVYLRSWF